MGTFFDFFSDDDIEVRNFEYEVVGIYLTLDQTPSVNDALIGGTFESITTTENGFFLRFKNPYKRDLSLLYCNEVLNAYPLITASAYKEAEKRSLVVTNDFSLYTFEHDKLVGSTFLCAQELRGWAKIKKELMSKALFLFKWISIYYYCHCTH